MKRILKVYWHFIQMFLFYPVMIGLFLWLYFQNAHWTFGAVIIAAILIFDPIWRIMARNVWRILQRRKE